MNDSTGIFQVFDLSASLSYRARRAIETRIRAKGLTYAQYEALTALAQKDAMSQSELALALETDSTTAMVLRGSLEKKGLVARSPDAFDGRVMRLSLTGSGLSLLKEVKPIIEEIFSTAGELFSEQELKRLIPLLERLRDFAGAAMPVLARNGEPKRRGRPRKERPADEGAAEPKRRGRPRKAEPSEEDVPAAQAEPKKRGKQVASPAAAKAPRPKQAKPAGAKKPLASPPASPGSAPKAAAKAGGKKRAKPKAE